MSSGPIELIDQMLQTVAQLREEARRQHWLARIAAAPSAHEEEVAAAIAAELEFDRVRPKATASPSSAWVEPQTFPPILTDDDCPF